MKNITSFIILLAFAFCGFASDDFSAGHGDAGQFILRKAVDFGGVPLTTNGLPSITNSWRCMEDEYGVVIRMDREQYPVVVSYLKQAFGKPKFGPSVSEDGHAGGGGYRLTPKGGAIYFNHDTNFTDVAIILPMSQKKWNTEVLPKLIKAVSDSK